MSSELLLLLLQQLLFACAALSASAAPRVLLGNEVLRQSGFASLANENVAVLTNPSGLFPDTLQHIVDHLHFETNVSVSTVLAPEHGFRGDHQAESGDPDTYVDAATNLTVHSVYRKNRSDIQRVLRETNTTLLLVDIQDVGTRLYTFVWTMFDVLEAIASETARGRHSAQLASDNPAGEVAGRSLWAGIKVVVLDRPNPVGGVAVEGPMLNVSCCSSRYGKAPVTHRHGLTVGELALLYDGESFNGTLSRAKSLTVVPMQNWNRSMMWDATGLPWIPPSPNLPTPASAHFYLSTVFIEATTVSEGRGTTIPFQIFGAPGYDAEALTELLNNGLGCAATPKSDACFRAAYYTPTFFKYNNSLVCGTQWVRISSTDGLPLQVETSVDPDAVASSSATRFVGSPDSTARPSAGAATHQTGQEGPVVLHAEPESSSMLAAAVIIRALQKLSPSGQWAWDGSWFGTPGPLLMDLYSGTSALRLALDDVETFPTPADVVAHFNGDVQTFTTLRQPYLLYQ